MISLKNKLVQQLSEENFEFRNLLQQHQEFEKRISSYNKLIHLSSKEEIDRKTLQKKKLVLKDRLSNMLAHANHTQI